MKLLLEEDDPEELLVLREKLAAADDLFLLDLLGAADIYDTVKILTLLPEVSKELAVVALCKAPPPYEPSPELIIDRLFQTVHSAKAGLLEEAAALLLQSTQVPAHFASSFARFREILKDQEFLSTLFPKARN